MDLIKYTLVLFVLFVDSDAGGHGEKHHDHVKLHVPEFIHHDHHTKVITIHHHHHKPKKEHHHHHHHHHQHKPHIIPHGNHYHHHQKKTTSHSISKGHSSHKGHGHHGHHGHHGQHGHHGHHGHHGSHGHSSHHGHEHKHHDIPSVGYDSPSVSYDHPPISYEPPKFNYNPGPSYGSDYGSFTPSVPDIPSTPHVHGVVHTVKQVKVFDSLPGALPGVSTGNANTPSHGYEVKEQEEEGEDDVFTAVNTLSQTYPGTFGYVRSAAAHSENDPFSEIVQQSTAQSPNHDPFAAVEHPTSFANFEGATGSDDTFGTVSVPTQGTSLTNIQPSQFTGNAINDATGFDDPNNIIIGDVSSTALLSPDEGFGGESPVSFSREAGIQQTIKTGGVESFVY